MTEKAKELLHRSFDRWAAFSLIFLGCLAFAPSVQFDFVNWDDPAYVWHNPLIRSWSPANLYGIATESVTRNYAPLTIASLLMDYSLWGMNAGGYHGTNVILHCVNGVLLYLLLRQLTSSRSVAWLTAALFVVHPVQIETVAWVSSRKGILSATFMLGALICRLRPQSRPGDDGWYIGFLSAALLSKALAVVLPPMVLLYDVLIRRDRVSDAVVRQVVPGLLSLLLLLHTMGAQNEVLGGVRSHMDLSMAQILAVDVTILCRYIGMLFAPVDLCVLYDPPTTGILYSVLGGLMLWAGAAGILWHFRSRHPIWLWGALCFLLLLLPVLNFFRITTLMNDRYLYLPCIVVFAMVAAALRRLAEIGVHSGSSLLTWLSGSVAAGIAATAVAGSLYLTDCHLPVWRNSDSLWTHTMQHVPQLAVVRIQLALTLYDSNRVSEAVQVLTRALEECAADQQDQERMARAVKDWSVELLKVSAVSAHVEGS